MLNGQIIEEWEGIDLPEQIRNKVIQIINWEGGAPPFPSVGRTAFLALNTPITVPGSTDKVIHSLKIKGVGLRDYSGAVSFPSTTPYYRANKHLGFDNTGQSISVASDPSPLGGMTLPRARAEFECARNLFESSCPAEWPVALAVYPDLAFNCAGLTPSKLGAVVCGLPVKSPARLNDLLVPEKRSHFATCLDNERAAQEHYELLRCIYLKIGIALRKFHQSGFYRYSGHPGNFIVNPDNQEVILVDLDSSQKIGHALIPTLQLYLVRDIASAIYHLGAYVLRSDNINEWSYTPEQSVDLMAQVLRGYLLGRSEAFLNYFQTKYLPTYAQAVRIAPERHAIAQRTEAPSVDEYQAYRTSILHHYWVNRDEHFSKIMSLLTPFLDVNDDGQKYLVVKDTPQ